MLVEVNVFVKIVDKELGTTNWFDNASPHDASGRIDVCVVGTVERRYYIILEERMQYNTST